MPFLKLSPQSSKKKLLGVDFFSPAHYTEMEFSVILPAVAEFYVPYNGRFSQHYVK